MVLGAAWPAAGSTVGLLGSLFVGALKAVAPVLVFVLVASAIAQHKEGNEVRVKPILVLYLLGTFSAAVVAVLASFAFPTKIVLAAGAGDAVPPSGIAEVLKTLLMNLVANPVSALSNANYIGILAWAVLLVVLVGCMVFIALAVNPLIVWWKIRRNPYPLVWTCLRESGVTAFFTRSSAANIPVNMALCKKLGLHEDTYSVSIPLGANINMVGAAITITVLALSAAYTQGIQVDFMTALLLSLVATVSACGASGVAGGSLLLVPLACSLFGI